MEMMQQCLAIALVLGALGGLLWLLKRKGWARPRRGSLTDLRVRLEVIDRLALTPHHSLHLIRHADRTLLVALSPASCSLLESLPVSEISAAELDAKCSGSF
jgi:flagellar biogenesis protein FliO